MQPSSLRSALVSGLAFGALLFLGGCRNQGDPFNMSRRVAAWSASKQSARQDLIQIPSPAKNVYAAIDQESRWQNPFLTVESKMIQVRIYVADENSSELDRGGMTRLNAARKHILNVRLRDLPRALASLPNSAWPYGRVVAVGEELEAPQHQARLQSNLKITVGALDDMGIVVDDFSDRGPMH